MLELILGWFLFAIVVAVAANTRGRSGLGWFFLAVILSPLIAGLFVLALPSRRQTTNQNLQLPDATPFQPDGVLNGIPYRMADGGQVEALLPGGRVMLHNLDHLKATAGGQTVEPIPSSVSSAYPMQHKGFRYRMDSDNAVSALTPSGRQQRYENWAAFWEAAERK